MSLAALQLADLRCLQSASLELHPRLNLISGDNGAGKTSLLEAIFLLGRGRSFRTRHTAQLIRHGAQRLWVHGHTTPPPGHSLGMDCQRDEGIQIRIDRLPAGSRVELSQLLPVQVIDPGIHRLLEDGPAQRRRWFDWAMFHVEPNFMRHWQGYTRALRQRNAALQSGGELAPWDAELSRLGELLTAGRARLLEELQPYWNAARTSLGAVDVALGFFQGWSREMSLADSIRAHTGRDQDRGATGVGPHRFDILLRLEGRSAREIVSRGQQKLLGIAMALAMARYLAERADRPTTLLLDDPAAELDAERTAALLATVRDLGAQLVVTTLQPEDERLGVPDAVFHVERGVVRQLQAGS
ncbi:MAG TPA: DNA replication/repair protein RecF [Steroidobacteraceae bacterium]